MDSRDVHLRLLFQPLQILNLLCQVVSGDQRILKPLVHLIRCLVGERDHEDFSHVKIRHSVHQEHDTVHHDLGLPRPRGCLHDDMLLRLAMLNAVLGSVKHRAKILQSINQPLAVVSIYNDPRSVMVEYVCLQKKCFGKIMEFLLQHRYILFGSKPDYFDTVLEPVLYFVFIVCNILIAEQNRVFRFHGRLHFPDCRNLKL